MLTKIYRSIINSLYANTEEDVYKAIGAEIKKLVKAKYCSIYLFKNGFLHQVWASSPILYIVSNRPRGAVYKAFKAKKSFLMPAKEIIKVHPQFQLLGVNVSLGIPLTYRNKVIGLVTAYSYKNRRFTQDDIKTLKLLAPVAALIIHKTLLYDNIQKAVNNRDLFMSMAAHELKTPLTVIYAYTQILAQKITSDSMPDIRLVDKLLEQERMLTSLINQFLEVGQINKGLISYQMKKTNLCLLLSEAISYFHLQYPFHKLKFPKTLIDKPLYILGDENKLKEAITNLLNNAAKYSPKGSTVTVDTQRQDDEYKITIKDEGIGIPKEDISKIYQPFYRSANTGNNGLGLGLGLYLVKTIVDKHHGKIIIHSQLHRGTEITVSLPAYDVENRR